MERMRVCELGCALIMDLNIRNLLDSVKWLLWIFHVSWCVVFFCIAQIKLCSIRGFFARVKKNPSTFFGRSSDMGLLWMTTQNKMDLRTNCDSATYSNEGFEGRKWFNGYYHYYFSGLLNGVHVLVIYRDE